MTHEIYIDIVFDSFPSHEAPRFVEVEDNAGKSLRVGEWLRRSDGQCVLRIRDTDIGDIYV